MRAPLGWLLAAVGTVLLVVCVNVASPLSAHGLLRRRELAVRSALGGGAADLVRHVLAESALLAGLGGLVGVGVAHACRLSRSRQRRLEVPRLGEVGIDGLALALAGGAAVISAIGCGLPPAWRASRTAPTAVPQGRRADRERPFGQRLGDLLVGAQVTLTVVLLVAAGLFWPASCGSWGATGGSTRPRSSPSI